jgi:hypothetical protein
MHPSIDRPDANGPRIDQVEICGDRDKVVDWLGEPIGGIDFRVDWVDADEPGLNAVHFETVHGLVRLD